MRADSFDRLARCAFAFCGALALIVSARAWQATGGPLWPRGNIVMQLQLDATPPSTPLSDGSAKWGDVAASALADWNTHLTISQFTWVANSTAPANPDPSTTNGYNNVRWGNTIYGEAWGAGSDVAGITLSWYNNDQLTEADVIFNTSAGMQWDSYRGALRYQSNGQPINDLKRVALHEFGHALGLDHPDQHGQSVAAIMNSVTSNVDDLTADDVAGGQHFYAAVLPPEITVQPIAAQTVALGGTTDFFEVEVHGTPPFTYQWYRDTTALTSNAVFRSWAFKLIGTTKSDYGTYTCVVSNSAGAVTTSSSVLSQTGVAPLFSTQPSSRTVAPGSTVTFTVAVVASPAASIQWRKNGVNLTNSGNVSGATATTLTLTNVSSADAGTYTAVATNSAGSVTSDAATLTVGALSTRGRIINMSVLTNIAVGEEMTFGFYTGGGGTSGPKAILMRAMGPTLGADPFNIGGVLGDPYLKFFNDTTLVDQNDNWGGVTAIANAASAVGAFPFVSTGSKDAGIYRTDITADTGHSIKVSGANGTSGTVIAELYDATSASAFIAATPRLINVSLLKTVGASTTLGFYLDGGSPVKVLIRAIGPSIGVAPFNVGGAMADPKFSVFQQGASTSFASNDDWNNNAAVNAAVAQTGAFPVAANSKDAATVLTLNPGGYSVQVSAATGATGVALIEVYEVP